MAADMRGRKILDVTRRGKVLYFQLGSSPERMLAVHLRMSGRMEVAKGAKVSKAALRHGSGQAKVAKERRWIHFRWRLSGGRELRLVDPRKFGIVWYGSPEDLAHDPYLGRLGHDAHTLSASEFSYAVAHSGGMVKPFLLRQDRLAGIGNIIADEALWRAGIHPETRITYLDSQARRRLHQAIQRTIRVMLSSGGTSIRNWASPDGTRGRFQERRLVYGKSGAPCPRCRTTLERIIVGGRGTAICPQCQRHDGKP